MILEIGEWACGEACYTLKRWRQHGQERFVDGGQRVGAAVAAQRPAQVVARVLEETGVPAECLELELTESVVMANAAQTSATLQCVPRSGRVTGIDDFGTGYSSLAYLKRLPITTLKIDKEFIGDLTRDAGRRGDHQHGNRDGAFARMSVVAEGVEEEAQMQFLRDHRCDEIQGYWLSPPLDRTAASPYSCVGAQPDRGTNGLSRRGSVPADNRCPAALTDSLPAAYRAGMDNTDRSPSYAHCRTPGPAHRARAAAGRRERSLRQQQEQLAGEARQLLAKNEQARSRVEAMITRLKSLEQHT
jgi:uncharacterized protein (TIGR02449 family)